MSERKVALKTRQEAFSTLLSACPDAIVAAIADDGSRIPLPDSVPVSESQALPVSEVSETMLNVVIPADRMTVVAAWERTREKGIGMTAVHAIGDAETRLTLTMIVAAFVRLVPRLEPSLAGPRAREHAPIVGVSAGEPSPV